MLLDVVGASLQHANAFGWLVLHQKHPPPLHMPLAPHTQSIATYPEPLMLLNVVCASLQHADALGWLALQQAHNQVTTSWRHIGRVLDGPAVVNNAAHDLQDGSRKVRECGEV